MLANGCMSARPRCSPTAFGALTNAHTRAHALAHTSRRAHPSRSGHHVHATCVHVLVPISIVFLRQLKHLFIETALPSLHARARPGATHTHPPRGPQCSHETERCPCRVPCARQGRPVVALALLAVCRSLAHGRHAHRGLYVLPTLGMM